MKNKLSCHAKWHPVQPRQNWTLAVGMHAMLSKVGDGVGTSPFANSLICLQRDSLQPEPSPNEMRYWHWLCPPASTSEHNLGRSQHVLFYSGYTVRPVEVSSLQWEHPKFKRLLISESKQDQAYFNCKRVWLMIFTEVRHIDWARYIDTNIIYWMFSRSLSEVMLILNSLKFSASNVADQRARAQHCLLMLEKAPVS